MLRLLLLAAAAMPALADTVEFIRGDKVNGTVTLSGAQFTITAEFAQGGKREIRVDRKFVSTIEVNATTSNAGAPPANFGLFQPSEAEKFELQTQDMLRTKGGERLRGRLEALGPTSARYNGEEISRADIVDILLGSAILYR
jgi:hypothetical protein